ncbi:MAG: acylpyruvate hydrolase [Actinomycetota bacterium]|nr:acylpyruvate hydrolase [Actinomycetota bacterium]
MKLATARMAGSTRAVKVEGDTLIDLGAADLGAFLARPDWRELAAAATQPTYPGADVQFATLVPRPSKVLCVGLNYRTHILEMGRDLPTYPTVFAKFAETLIGPTDDIKRPAETQAFDWEVELAVVIGASVRRASPAQAEAAIAGFTVLNDITCRDWQNRTIEWLQGKAWEGTTPVGPFLVTPDELPGGVRPTLDVSLSVNGEQMQADTTADLLFDPVALVTYLSTVITLNPGDIIATGTPSGVGHARRPERYLTGGERVVAEIAGLGRLDNLVVEDW